MIEKLSRLWAGSIAYVALLAGAGLSVAGNVADTFRTLGDPSRLAIVLAAAWPILVLLTIELFVSRKWSTSTGFQVLRWTGCLSIGAMAMMSSWVHLHDLLASQAQIQPVAIGGPLAIDGMAIMATGLLLSTRGRLATSRPSLSDRFAAAVDTLATGEHHVATEQTWTQADDDMWARLSSDLDATTSPAFPVSGAPALARSNEIKPESVPEDVAMLIKAWETTDPAVRPTLKDMAALLAAETGRSDRTIRRYRDALKG